MERIQHALYNELSFVRELAVVVRTWKDQSFITKMDAFLKVKACLIRFNKYHGVQYNYLKGKQCETICCAISKDTIAVLPTGSGKSLIYYVLPFANITHRSTIIISCPLDSIIFEQSEKLNKSCIIVNQNTISALQCNSDAEEIKRLKRAECLYVIGHPESLIDQSMKTLFLNEYWQRSVSHLVIDEVHCVETWGEKFRKAFKKIKTLRAIFPNIKILALTATARPATVEAIASILLMDTYKTVTSSPDRYCSI